jgi:hypothetical protein
MDTGVYNYTIRFPRKAQASKPSNWRKNAISGSSEAVSLVAGGWCLLKALQFNQIM